MSGYAKLAPAEDPDDEDDSPDMEEEARLGVSDHPERQTLVAGSGGSPRSAKPAGSKSSMLLKLTILVSVTLQNTGYALVRRYSRGHLKEKYSTSSALLLMEVAKLFVSMVMVVWGGQPSDVPAGGACSKFCYLISHSWKMMVPAVIYLVMNILGFMALGHLDASTFAIIAQMKVFSTALFSVLILSRALAPRKWRALATLTLGVILISNEAFPKAHGSTATDAQKVELRHFAIGMAASLGDVLLSGFASIYFEMVLKSKTET